MQRFKKSLALVLTLIICITALPLSALTVAAETIKIGYISGEDVNIRKSASTSSDKVSAVTKWTVEVIGEKDDTLGTINPKTKKVYKWYQVSYTSFSNTIKGYVREDLITVDEYELDPDFEKEIKDFPSSYKSALTILHAIYPNWEFKADKTTESFETLVSAQDTDFRKLVVYNYPSLRSMGKGCYNWNKNKFISTDTGKYAASREVISYFMDPRNFLNANDIYIFMQQSFDSEAQTKKGVEKIIEDTFLDKKITNKKDEYYGKTFATVIMAAAKKSKVNPYVLASTIIQEQGRKGSTLGKGITYKKKTVYNFFNYGASGSNSEEVYKNGAKYAYDAKWTTESKSLIEGAVKYGSGYIAVGQDTYFYKNYNVLNPQKIWHQYAQSVHDSLSSSRFLKTNYADYKDIKVTFRIPVYEDMPKKVCAYPKENDNLNNYYFEAITVDGLSPQFDKYNFSYNLTVTKDTDIFVELLENTTYESDRTFNLKKGENKISLKVKSQTGKTRTYTINVTAQDKCVLTIKQLGGTLVEEDGVLNYYVNGEKSEETTLVKYKGKYYYIEKGAHAKKTTFVKYAGKYHYVEEGIFNPITNFIKYKDKTYFVEKGIRESETKFVEFNKKTYYLKKGVRSSDTKFVKVSGKYYYIKKGTLQKITQFVKYDKKYYYIKDGVRSSKTGFVKYKDKYYKLKKGVRVSTNTYKKYGKLYLRLSTTSFAYTAKSRKPSVKVYTSNGDKLAKKYYNFYYAYGRKYVGKYAVSVVFKGKYSGSKKLYFTIVPNETKITKLTATKNTIKVKLKKQPIQSSGYELEYSSSSDFKKSKKQTLKGYGTTSAVISKLKSKTTYYVRIRTYKVIGDKKYYSAWSEYKSKKTKK